MPFLVTINVLTLHSRHHIAVSSDLMTFAAGGTDGTIHVYNWEGRKKITHHTVVAYHRSYLEA